MTSLLSTWDRAPRALRASRTKMDNIALVPASELPALHTWQQRSRRISAGNMLIVVPANNVRMHQVGQSIRRVLANEGRACCLATVQSKRSQ